MLQCENITFTINKKEIIRNVSFKLNENRCLAIVGPSGCGKTTLLKIISGILKLTTGKVIWKEKEYQNFPPEKRDCTLVFQEPLLFPHLSVLENVAFGIFSPHKKEKATLWIKRFHAEHLLSQNIHTLSGGEIQRIALARAFATEKKLILLDEPWSHVDSFMKKSLIDTVKEVLENTKTTFILVTHDIQDAKILTDSCIAMEKGRISLLKKENIL